MESGEVAEPWPKIPTVLKVVAALFIFEGISAAIEILVSMIHGHISLNFGILNFFAGLGMLRLNPGWRTCGLVFLWLMFIAMPIGILAVFVRSTPIPFKIFGQPAGVASKEAVLAICLIAFLVSLWQYRVLTRPDIRSLFGLPATR